MKLYRCDLCGRIFHERIPHICIHGNYRKRHLTFTEFEDVDNEYIKKSEVDVKENHFPNIPQGALILNEPLKSKIEHLVNWEQARIDATIAIAQGFVSNDNIFGMNDCEDEEQYAKKRLAKISVSFADALIAELKK